MSILIDPNRASESSSSEDLFVEIFQEALGFEKTQLLVPQFSVSDIYDTGRFIDFALISQFAKYAFEIDGEIWHSPDSSMVSNRDYRDELLRQNSLIYQGWKVYRWTDVQLATEREKIKEQLFLFLEREIIEGTLDGFLPLQEGGEISLLNHQSNALQELQTLRNEGKTIALITHATGTGKTHIALSDAKNLGFRTLYLVHRKKVVSQTLERFAEIWANASSEIYRKKQGKPNTQIVLSTIQAISSSLNEFDEREFGYIIIDEAHHATAETYRKILNYFKPKFILGLTATPERHDGQSLIEIFQNSAHRLELEEAIARELLVPIRCVRVKTNIDLTKIRFNGVDYRSKDLGEYLFVPSRDRLIVETYINHALNKRAVCFCLNIKHAEDITAEFKSNGVSASHISGRMKNQEREEILQAYHAGKIKVLCACDILNEGWDSPETEVLLMARPTLSKVIYLQQLGRGTRCASGKEYLLVFDFIDNTTRYARSINTHYLFNKTSYRPGAFVAAPQEMMKEEEKQLNRGEKPSVMLTLNLWADRYEPIDIFRWQDEAKEMYQTSEIETRLGIGESVVRRWVESGKLIPDHTIELGNRVYHYFKKDRLEQIRKDFNIPRLTDEDIKKRFFEFVRKMSMNTSYKPVLLLGLLKLADAQGRIKTQELTQFFQDYYLQRLNQNLIVERNNAKMSRIAELSCSEIEAIILSKPFEKFEKRKFLRRLKEITILKFSEPLWRSLTDTDKSELQNLAEVALQKYYNRF
ncbi:DEAD/DEAH box helicase family protein [Spirulina sp. 06S082]|uniref:DEAD/DEAH box helicase family protein n=1 Tax=Spirulina sp. 06S082 TaxID=3110248 RepID=UPI002B210222|nr:DEAD/DEAH box helicase family protein [Spirulina sp. 06S082]MEA5469163.1 DEAD/DEAH box helicase family protein [Spirulina sp. 06S082]